MKRHVNIQIKNHLLTYFLYSPMPCFLCTHTHTCWKVSFFPPWYKKKVITQKAFRITHTTHNLCRLNVNITVLHHHFHFTFQQKPQQNFTIVLSLITATSLKFTSSHYKAAAKNTLRKYRMAHWDTSKEGALHLDLCYSNYCNNKELLITLNSLFLNTLYIL
jgi:hypothetical protein